MFVNVGPGRSASVTARVENTALPIFQALPNRIHLFQLDLTKLLSSRAQSLFELIEAVHEFVGCAVQHHFRIETAFPRQIHYRKKQIANFVCDLVARDSSA